jgi:hypothetical protein
VRHKPRTQPICECWVRAEDLDELVDTWLFTPGKPDVATAIASRSALLPEMDAQRRVAARRALHR